MRPSGALGSLVAGRKYLAGMPTGKRVFVEVHIRQRIDESQAVSHRLIKALDEPFWEMPVPDDQIRLSAPAPTTEIQSVAPDGALNMLTTWSGEMASVQLTVLRRMWIPEGVLLVCEPWSPVESAMEPAEILEAFLRLGFEVVSSGPGGADPAY
jgi:hypothetical protein